jgi:acyl transferase domain-containing protein
VFLAKLHINILDDWLSDHIVKDKILFPGVAFLEFINAAGLKHLSSISSQVSSRSQPVLFCEGVTIHNPLIVEDVRHSHGESKMTSMIGVAESLSETGCLVKVYSTDTDKGRVLHAEGSFETVDATSMRKTSLGNSSSGFTASESDWSKLSSHVSSRQSTCVIEMDPATLYGMLSSRGLSYGPRFHLLRDVRVSSDGLSVLNRLILDELMVCSSGYVLCPSVLDALLQSSMAGIYQARGGSLGSIQVPFSFEKVWVRPDVCQDLGVGSCVGLVEIRSMESEMTVFDCSLMNTRGDVAVRLEGVYTRSYNSTSSSTLYPKMLELDSIWSSTRESDQSMSNSLALGLTAAPTPLTFLSKASRVVYIGDEDLSRVELDGGFHFDRLSIGAELSSLHVSDLTILVNPLELLGSSSEVPCTSSELLSRWLTILPNLCKSSRRVLVVISSQVLDQNDEEASILAFSLSGSLKCAQIEYPLVSMSILNCSGCRV